MTPDFSSEMTDDASIPMIKPDGMFSTFDTNRVSDRTSYDGPRSTHAGISIISAATDAHIRYNKAFFIVKLSL